MDETQKAFDRGYAAGYAAGVASTQPKTKPRMARSHQAICAALSKNRHGMRVVDIVRDTRDNFQDVSGDSIGMMLKKYNGKDFRRDGFRWFLL